MAFLSLSSCGNKEPPKFYVPQSQRHIMPEEQIVLYTSSKEEKYSPIDILPEPTLARAAPYSGIYYEKPSLPSKPKTLEDVSLVGFWGKFKLSMLSFKDILIERSVWIGDGNKIYPFSINKYFGLDVGDKKYSMYVTPMNPESSAVESIRRVDISETEVKLYTNDMEFLYARKGWDHDSQHPPYSGRDKYAPIKVKYESKKTIFKNKANLSMKW